MMRMAAVRRPIYLARHMPAGFKGRPSCRTQKGRYCEVKLSHQDVVDYLLSPTTGRPFIYEDNGCRQLHFDLMSVQASMRLDSPFDLELEYTRTMMMALLLKPAPRDILIVGLGGGSLAKFCYQYLPDSRITTVEIDQEVIALRHQFMIPDDSERFRVVHQDASRYMVKQEDCADVILLDGFDVFGLPKPLSTEAFYRGCYRALRKGGVLASNLLGSDLRYGVYLMRLRRCFDAPLFQIQPEDGSNKIVIVAKQAAIPEWPTLWARNESIKQNLGLDFSRYLKAMEVQTDINSQHYRATFQDPVVSAPVSMSETE